MHKTAHHCNQFFLSRSTKKADLSDIGMLSRCYQWKKQCLHIKINDRKALQVSQESCLRTCFLPIHIMPAKQYLGEFAANIIRNKRWCENCACNASCIITLILHCKRHSFAKSLNSSSPSKETTRAISNANTSANSSSKKF